MLNKGLKALAIKEVRERIYSLIVFVLVVAGIRFFVQYSGAGRLEEGYYSYFQFNIACCWALPMYALYLGVTTFGYEKSKGTMTYLLTLPNEKISLYLLKTLVSGLYLTVAILMMPLFVNDSASIGIDNLIYYGFETASYGIIPLILFTFMSFGMGLLGAVIGTDLLSCAGIGSVIFIGCLLSFASLELMEALSFSMIFGIGAALLTGHLISPSRRIQGTREVVGRAAKYLAISFVTLYFSLHGWNLVQGMWPGEYQFHGLRTFAPGPVISLTEECPLFAKNGIRQFAINDGKLDSFSNLRNHSLFTMSSDGKMKMFLDGRNHWGFYIREPQLRAYDEDFNVLYTGQPGDYFSPCWSKDGKKLAYFFKEEMAFMNLGPRREWQLIILDTTAMSSQVVKFTKHHIDTHPSIFGWDKSDEHIYVRAKSDLEINIDSKSKTIEEDAIIKVSLDGTIEAVDESLVSLDYVKFVRRCKNGSVYFSYSKSDTEVLALWKEGSVTDTYEVPSSWSIESISTDRKWVALSKIDSPEEKREGPRAFNYWGTVKFGRTFTVVSIEAPSSKTMKVTDDSLRKQSLVNYDFRFGVREDSLLGSDIKWYSKEKAFILFTPGPERESMVTYYYPETKTQKIMFSIDGAL